MCLQPEAGPFMRASCTVLTAGKACYGQLQKRKVPYSDGCRTLPFLSVTIDRQKNCDKSLNGHESTQV